MAFRDLSVALLSGAALVAPAHGAAAHLFHADHVLGTSLDMAVVSASAPMAELAMALVRAEIARLDAILSGWRDDSELALLNRVGRRGVARLIYCDRSGRSLAGAQRRRF